MKVSAKAISLAMARNAATRKDILSREPALNEQAWCRAISGKSVSPRTVGLIARALGVDPADILLDPETEGSEK